MSLIVGGTILAAGAALLTGVALSEAARLRKRRKSLLDPCLALFDEAEVKIGGDGYPSLSGRAGSARYDVALIPDMMTIRRLPQLWLSVTLRADLPVEASLAALARPCGTEFYALTHRLDVRLSVPAGFPPETMLRGRGRGAGALLARLSRAMAARLADPAVKEVAVTPRGARIVRQAAEGRRGDYLLLRQATFDIAAVEPAMLLPLMDSLSGLRHSATVTPAPALGAERRE